MSEEKVLAIPRALVDSVGQISGLYLNPAPYLKMIRHKSTRFLLRGPAETDINNKQVIPYILIKRGGSLFVHYRNKKGGEARLVDKASIGIGGHINLKDEPIFGLSPNYSAFLIGAKREIGEEVRISNVTSKAPIHFVGIMNDDSTPVGRVHLGFIGVMLLPVKAKVETLCESLAGGKFVRIKDLEQPSHPDFARLENWSKLIICNIGRLLDHLEKEKEYEPEIAV